MFIERRSNGVWYYKKVSIVDGARKVLRKSLNTYCKREAQLRAMHVYFEIDNSIESIVLPTKQVSSTPSPVQVEPLSICESQPAQELDVCEPTPVPDSSSKKIQVILDAYLTENKHLWGTKEAQAQRAAIERFIVNANVNCIEQCTKQVAVDFKQGLIASGLSNVTINKLIGKVSNFFDYIEAHYSHSNVFKGLKVKRAKQETKRTAYTPQEVSKLRNFADKQESHRKFMILLGLFTGARAGELAQLYTSDIVKIDGIWSILIRATKPDQKLKTVNAERVVPVHSELIKAGFIEFVKGRGDDCRLFPEFKYSPVDGCSKAFVQWFIQCKPISKTYHEIRHSFATALRSADVSLNIAAQLLGHGTGQISWDRYGSTAQTQIHLLKKAVEVVSYA